MSGTSNQPHTRNPVGFSTWYAPMNYGFGVAAMLRIGKHYTVTTVFFLASAFSYLGIENLVLSRLGTDFFDLGAWLAVFPVTFAFIYVIAVQFRVLGLLYHCHKDEMGIFD